jgi:glycosyltransferase involved in cell wall biosynthesis
MNDGSEVRVGYTQYNYNAARNCYAPVPGVRHERIGRVPVDRLVGHGTAISLRQGIYVPLGRSRVDIVHLWNQISVGRGPWGVSFESGLPRVPRGRGYRFLQGRLTSTTCRFVVGISSFARDSFLNDLPRDVRAEIEPKTTVVYPYQHANASTQIVAPAENEPLKLIFVGGDFFRKGGEAVLRFVERFGSHYNVQALVVSDVASRDWASPWSYDEQYVASIRRRLEEEERVAWISSLPNSEVLEAMKRSHVLLFPTLSDTFGYVSLEAMSCGLPVVATTVQAMPEVVDPSVGWTIELPVGGDRYWEGFIDEAWASHPDAYEDAMDRIVRGLAQAVEEVRADPATLRERSARCGARVEGRFGTERTAHLKAVYATVER